MFSPDPPAPHTLATRPGPRRGGPTLFRTIWPGVRATLLDGLLEGPPDDRPLEVAGPGDRPPPWSRAA